MNVMMVRAKIEEENVARAQAATGMVLQALEQAQLNVRYAASTLSDRVALVAFLPARAPVGSIRYAFPYVELSSTSRAGTPSRRNVEHITVIGSVYQLF